MHALTVRKDKKVEFAFVEGVKPWHGLGNELKPGATKEQWRKAAGMDWRIGKSFVRYATGPGNNHLKLFKQQVVLYRSDNEHPLAIVSDKYKVVQPEQVLSFFDDLAHGGGFSLTTAGTLFEGRRFWALAKVEDAVIVGEDVVNAYLLLATAADGSLNTIADFVTECVVCNNTLNMALAEDSKRRVAISHRSKFKPDEIKAKLGIARGEFSKFLNAARTLAAKKISDRTAAKFVADLLVKESMINEDKDLSSNKHFAKIMSLFQGEGKGATMPGRAHTAWGAVNAITEYVDHHARAKTDSHRMNNAWFGRGDEVKTSAMEAALKAFAV